MHRVLIPVPPILLAASLTFSLSGGDHAGTPDPAPSSCASMCTMVYDPVTCVFSDGVTRTFGNDCVARNYACEHGLRIIGCVPRRGSVDR